MLTREKWNVNYLVQTLSKTSLQAFLQWNGPIYRSFCMWAQQVPAKMQWQSLPTFSAHKISTVVQNKNIRNFLGKLITVYKRHSIVNPSSRVSLGVDTVCTKKKKKETKTHYWIQDFQKPRSEWWQFKLLTNQIKPKC